ncbi:MAG: hypothetical protein AVDCRST_MAG01-01-4976 [uncultured Rubrobacteraceae bacterium]|uniref:Uncharacterized protein n=1 Tax=uncultured Rubrobacteraceae bacterium TaxID=349277 RepID=A0A6J4R375_9ACTN|nr:MAG: hypothetical protein AVDCRST_MAG01-01-4976 [uncultured Rubrobacteraceae bacterium]
MHGFLLRRPGHLCRAEVRRLCAPASRRVCPSRGSIAPYQDPPDPCSVLYYAGSAGTDHPGVPPRTSQNLLNPKFRELPFRNRLKNARRFLNGGFLAARSGRIRGPLYPSGGLRSLDPSPSDFPDSLSTRLSE